MARHVDHIVVGLQDAPDARAALDHALHEAVRRGGRVVTVTAFTDPRHWTRLEQVGGFDVREEDLAQVTEDVRVQARRLVQQALQDLARTTVVLPPVTVLAVGGKPGEALVHAASTADLLVVGSRSRGAIAGALLGSVSLYCVLHAPCPVTVVRAPATTPTGIAPIGAGAGWAR